MESCLSLIFKKPLSGESVRVLKAGLGNASRLLNFCKATLAIMLCSVPTARVEM